MLETDGLAGVNDGAGLIVGEGVRTAGPSVADKNDRLGLEIKKSKMGECNISSRICFIG